MTIRQGVRMISAMAVTGCSASAAMLGLALCACTPPDPPPQLGPGTWATTPPTTAAPTTTTAPAPPSTTTTTRTAPTTTAYNIGDACAAAIGDVLPRIADLPPSVNIHCPASIKKTYGHLGWAHVPAALSPDSPWVAIHGSAAADPRTLRWVVAHELCHVAHGKPVVLPGGSFGMGDMSEATADACAAAAGFPRTVA